jgi:hypothetical protein
MGASVRKLHESVSPDTAPEILDALEKMDVPPEPKPVQLRIDHADAVAGAIVRGMKQLLRRGLQKQEAEFRKREAALIERFEVRLREMKKRTELCEDRTAEIERDLSRVLHNIEMLENRMVRR